MHIIANSFGLPCNPASLTLKVAWSDISNPPVKVPPITEIKVPTIIEYQKTLAEFADVMSTVVTIINPSSCI